MPLLLQPEWELVLVLMVDAKLVPVLALVG